MKGLHEACPHWLVCVGGESDSLSVGRSVLNSLYNKLTPCIYIYLINLFKVHLQLGKPSNKQKTIESVSMLIPPSHPTPPLLTVSALVYFFPDVFLDY